MAARRLVPEWGGLHRFHLLINCTGGFVWHVRSAEPSAHATQSTFGADTGKGTDGLSASAPSPISQRGKMPSQPTHGGRLAGGEILINLRISLYRMTASYDLYS
eukprot:4014358-Pleurochrysis_carterae.AAC.1